MLVFATTVNALVFVSFVANRCLCCLPGLLAMAVLYCKDLKPKTLLSALTNTRNHEV